MYYHGIWKTILLPGLDFVFLIYKEACDALPKHGRAVISGSFRSYIFTEVNKANSAQNSMTDSKHLWEVGQN